MKRYWIYRASRLVGGIEAHPDAISRVEAAGYRVVPVSGWDR